MGQKCLALSIATLILFVIAGCLSKPSETKPNAASQPNSASVFVGNTACAECHRMEFDAHRQSRHALTMAVVSKQSLGDMAPQEGKFEGTEFILKQKDGRYAFSEPSRSDEISPVDYALGSGKTGVTYVAISGPEELLEYRFSYFPKEKAWYATPGQERLGPEEIGRIHKGANARKCLGCHTVTLPSSDMRPEARFLGVGCEACHGPGSRHVDAMRTGNRSAGEMEKLSHLPAATLDARCAQCHGRPEIVSKSRSAHGATNRYQVWGLEQSRCFLSSRGRLSCITCHDPHTDASTDQKHYEAICLNCHSPRASDAHSTASMQVTSRPCPVNPKADCVQCHMPTRPAVSDSAVTTAMADHFIRVYRTK